jgi:hypothetical protein
VIELELGLTVHGYEALVDHNLGFLGVLPRGLVFHQLLPPSFT